MQNWTRLAVTIKSDATLNVDEVFYSLRRSYPVGYCALYRLDNVLCLYVQTISSNARMVPRKLQKLLAPFGAIGKPENYFHRHGVLLAEKGEFRGSGGSRKRTIHLPESDVHNESKSVVAQEKSSKRRMCNEPSGENFDDPLFVPIYTGFNRNWKIVSWNIYKKDFKRESGKPFREVVLKRQDNKCNYCRCEINFGEYSNADIDHVIGLHAGGQNVLNNVQALCVPCHRKKTALESRRVCISLSAIMDSAFIPQTKAKKPSMQGHFEKAEW